MRGQGVALGGGRSTRPSPVVYLGTVLLLACAPRAPEPVAPRAVVLFPPPPDTARIQFLTRISDSRDVGGSRRGLVRLLLGPRQQEEAQPRIIKPYGIAIHQGRIYVCDAMLPGIEIVDLARRTFEYFVPRGEGRLRKPINCAVDREDGRLYVADTERRQVVVFDAQGAYLYAIGGPGDRPTDVAVAGDRIWVADMDARQVRVYDKTTHRLLRAFPDAQTDGPGKLFSPTNLCVAGDRVYVTDFGDFKVRIYTVEGAYIGSVGSHGQAPGQFVRPKGVAVDRELNLYVVDAGFENVQIFDRDGRLLTFFGGKYEGPGYMWLPAKVVVDYDNLAYFERYVDHRFTLKYVILVTNQYGPDKVAVYGFVEANPAGVAAQQR